MAVVENIRVAVHYRVGEGTKFFSVLRNVWKERSLSMRAKLGMSVLYGFETLALDDKAQKMVNVLERKCLRTTCSLMKFN